MKIVYVVYNPNTQEPNIGKSIDVFEKEVDAARYASMNGLQVIEKVLI